VRILFLTATRIGDAVLSTLVLNHLLERHPQARVTVACGAPAAGVFARLPQLERLIVVEKRRFDLHWPVLWRQLALTWWDIGVDLRGSATTLLVPARQRLIMRGGRRPGHRSRHLAGVLGLADRPPFPVAWTAAEDRARAEALLPGDGPYVALGPTANWAGKVWPAEGFVAVFRAMAAQWPGTRAVVLGGPGETERAMAAPVLAALPGAVDLVGALSLPEAASVLARCALFVGNDSGLMHLAAAAGCRTLGLFGASDPGEYAPFGRATSFVAAAGAPHAPMSSLGVEEVLAAAEALVAAPLLTEAA
jgi:heptosyltransferase III